MKILLVDDSSFKRKALAYVIESHGHEVLEAVDGVEGLEKTRAYMPDIIISDLLMPRMDGFQFVRNIKKDEQLRAIPIIVYSATYKEGKERELALSLGVIGFIEDVGKPEIFWQELQEMIEGGLCKEGKVCKPIIEDDSEFLREYAPIIQAKLEKKIRELEEEVDKRKRTEEVLKSSENLLHIFVEYTPAAVAMFDRNMKYIVASRRYLADYHLSEQDLVGRSHYEVFPEIPERWKEIHRRCLAGAVEKSDRDPFQRADGRLDWVRWEIRPWYEPTGEVGGIILFSEVLTEQVWAEEALRESEAKFSMAFHSSPTMLALAKLDGKHVEVNRAYTDFIGYTREEIIGKSVVDLNFINEAERQKILELARKGGGSVYNAEIEVQLREGSLRHVLFSLNTVPIGGVPHRLATLVDITDRKKAEEALRESELRLRIISAHTPTFLVEIDHEGIIRYTNRTYEGIGQNQVINTHISEWFPEEQRAHINALIAEVFSSGKPQHTEYSIIIPKGELHHYSSEIVPVLDAGRVVTSIFTATDITERKRAEDQVRERERQLSTLISNLPGAVYRVRNDPNYTVEYVSNQITELTGFPADDFRESSRHLGDLIHPDDREWVWNKTQKALGEHRPYEFTYRFIDVKGQEKWNWERGVGIFGQNGELQAIEGFILDISERKKAEEALLESELRYRTSVENMLEAFGIYSAVRDAAGRIVDFEIVYVNPAACLVNRMTKEEQIGKRLLEILPAHKNTGLFDDYCQVVETGSPFAKDSVVYEDVYGKHSINRAFDIRAAKLGDGFIATWLDITDRKRAEEELRIRNEELLAINRIISTTTTTGVRAVLEKVMDEVLNITGLEGGTFCTVNPDESLHMVVHRATAEATIRDLTTHTIKIGDCLCGECARDRKPLILRDREEVLRFSTREAQRGEDIRFHAAYPLVTGEKCLGVFCIFTRTDRKPTERSLKLLETIAPQIAMAVENAIYYDKIQKNAAELEQKVEERTRLLSSANKELESFSYSVSHDLRAPLRAISGFAEIVRERHSSSLNEEGRHYVDNIVLAGARMGHLIDDLLAYARLGRATVRHEPVALRSIFDIVASDMAVRLTETGGTLKIADELPTVLGDKSLLSRIFTNLVENALTYRKSDVPPQVEVTYQNKNGRVIVRVSDNGIGIPTEHLEKIFNLFQRLQSDDEHPGTGVGLAIVKKSVELLGGSVRIESEVGKGSTFHIELVMSKVS